MSLSLPTIPLLLYYWNSWPISILISVLAPKLLFSFASVICLVCDLSLVRSMQGPQVPRIRGLLDQRCPGSISLNWINLTILCKIQIFFISSGANSFIFSSSIDSTNQILHMCANIIFVLTIQNVELPHFVSDIVVRTSETGETCPTDVAVSHCVLMVDIVPIYRGLHWGLCNTVSATVECRYHAYIKRRICACSSRIRQISLNKCIDSWSFNLFSAIHVLQRENKAYGKTYFSSSFVNDEVISQWYLPCGAIRAELRPEYLFSIWFQPDRHLPNWFQPDLQNSSLVWCYSWS